MIAWAGMERLKALEAGKFNAEVGGNWLNETGIYWEEREMEDLEPLPRLPVGRDISESVEALDIKINRRHPYYRLMKRQNNVIHQQL